MPDLDKPCELRSHLLRVIKEMSAHELNLLIDYTRSVIVWKNRPEMYLEPIVVIEGDNWSYTYAKEENSVDN